MLLFARAVFMIVVALCSMATYSAATPNVLFDEAHGQQFLVGKNGPLDLSELAVFYRANGASVASNADKLTEEALASVDVLVLSGPFLPLTESEIEVVLGFISAGGGLAVMLHVAPTVRDLLHRLDVDFTNGTLREGSQAIADNPLDFKVDVFLGHPVTTGVEFFSVYGAWALRGTASHVLIVAETSQQSWVDLDRNGQLSDRDAVQSFGVMVAGELGQGRYVVLGDDAVFQNRFFDGPNQQLALRLLKWLGPR